MAQTLRLDDAIMNELRQEAELHSRSLAMQAQHWMRIGKAVERSRAYSFDDIVEVLSHESNPKGSPDVKKGSVTDRVMYRLDNPTPEDEARFQEYIANN